MSTQHSSSTPEESIDLRRIIETLLRRWPIIVAALIISVITSVSYVFLTQPTVYESSGSALLPDNPIDSGMGFPSGAYLALASSSPVMELVRERLDSELSSGQLRSQFEFEMDTGQTISFTASANSAEQSFLLADTWLKSYQQELESLLKGQFNRKKVLSAQEVDSLLTQLTNAEENLAEHDLEYKPSTLQSELSNLKAIQARNASRLLELTLVSSLPTSQTDPGYVPVSENSAQSQLWYLEWELSTTTNRLRELHLSSIPVSKSRLVHLEKAIAEEPEYMSQPDHLGNFTLNPLYLKLNQDLADTKILLNVQLSEAAALFIKVGVLPAQIDDLLVDLSLSLEATILELRPKIRQLASRVGTEQTAHHKLEVNVTDSLAAYDLAKEELDRLFLIESQLASYTSLSTVREPAQPSGPVSQQRGRNIVLAMFLGLVIGVTAALVVDYYQIKPARATPIRE